MIDLRGKLPPEARGLLDRERDIPAQPAAVRARALVRARAALVAGIASRPAPVASEASPLRRWRVAVAALVCLASAAAAAAVYESHRHEALVAGPVASSVAVAPPPASPAPTSRSAASSVADLPAPPAPVRASGPSLAKADAIQEELRLLQQARAAVARGDFAAALPPLAEHGRRFKDGRLAEEREALRVKALAGLGRTGEARRAAAAFEARFPRSVLLPAVSRMPASAP
ncbi:MAG TPA: hypothetical protein VH853_07875 [Polyangia bacterium]|jgi:hypothetical protein|nr:hypothetical protein [Polyangia bacterium]